VQSYGIQSNVSPLFFSLPLDHEEVTLVLHNFVNFSPSDYAAAPSASISDNKSSKLNGPRKAARTPCLRGWCSAFPLALACCLPTVTSWASGALPVSPGTLNALSDPAPATYPVVDTFSGSGSLSANWTNTTSADQGYVSLAQSAGTVAPSVSGQHGLATYTGISFTNDQYAQAKFVAHSSAAGSTGVCVRMNAAGSGVCYLADWGLIYSLASGAGTNAIVSGCPIPASGDTIQLLVVGTTYTCTDVTTGASMSATDGTYSTGNPAILVDQRRSTVYALAQFQADCSPSCGNGSSPAATPTFNPAAGSYSSPQTVIVSSTTPSATIYYTTDGTTPTPSSAVYSGPLAVSSPETIKAIGTAVGYTASAVGSAAYTIVVASPQLTLSATNLSFGNVTVNTAATQSLTLTSKGTSPVTVNSVSITGAGFTIVAGTFPVTLTSNQSVTLQVQFKPTATRSTAGQLTISSDSTTGATAVVSLSGTGTTENPQLTASATSLQFGSVAVNTSTRLTLTLTSTGTTPVTVNSAAITGADFSIIGGSFPVTLNPTQALTLQLQFSPTTAGTLTGQITINSNSTTGSTAVVALNGNGTTVSHEVDLSWDAPTSSPDPVAGYNIYRSTDVGVAQLINSSIETQTAHVDSAVVSGATYSYIVKSVDKNGVESVASNQITVTIP
jgi:Chitobiase/beta-hexosaminidase C-terminal domain/Abnormal spindle-like microcephaly-assoc'd, ASPM-SPD-2-Hydin